MQNHQLVNQSSGVVEFYTPPFILEAVRKVMGRIELDPASCAKANETVGAKRFFAAPEWEASAWRNVEAGRESAHETLPLRKMIPSGAFHEKWEAETVWMNHPFGPPEHPCKPGCDKKICRKRGWHTASYIPGNSDWINLLCNAVKTGKVKTAMCITFAATSEKWIQPLMKHPQCFLSPRTNYLDANGKPLNGVTKGSVVTMIGDSGVYFNTFSEVFDGRLGTVKI